MLPPPSSDHPPDDLGPDQLHPHSSPSPTVSSPAPATAPPPAPEPPSRPADPAPAPSDSPKANRPPVTPPLVRSPTLGSPASHISDSAASEPAAAPPPPSSPPALPTESVPTAQDDGWGCQWDPNSQSWFFHNRLTNQTQWENPRLLAEPALDPHSDRPDRPDHPPLPSDQPAAGGYNPAVHGDYDPHAWYAQAATAAAGDHDGADAQADYYPSAEPDDDAFAPSFNRFTGKFQAAGAGPERHTDEAKSRRQLNAFFDLEAAANAHDGRSLRAERAGHKPTKTEIKQFKEKRKARKEEKRRAWLRD